MVKPAYIPRHGDFIWMDFDPQKGREIKKRRPAIVVSPGDYNRVTGLCLVCPVTSRRRGDYLEVPVTLKNVSGAIKSDQIKSFDWRDRNAAFIAKAPAKAVEHVLENIYKVLFDHR